MDFNLDVRLKQLQSLENYISSSWDKVNLVLDRLKWDAKEVSRDSQLIKCSIDPNHRIHINSAEEHIKKCSLRKEGYTVDEHFLSEPLHHPTNSISIDDHKKITILSNAHRTIPNFKSGWNGQDPDPKTSDRLMTTFSSDERLVLYNYAVENTQGLPKLPDFKVIEAPKHTKELTHEEVLLLERDMKRRRTKYKGIFTNHKNYTEVLREVINGQMELFKNSLEDTEEAKSSITEEGDSEKRIVSKHNDSESRTSTRSSSKSSNVYSKSYRDDRYYYKDYDCYDYKRHRDDYKNYKSRRHSEKKHKADLRDGQKHGDHYNSHKKR